MAWLTLSAAESTSPPRLGPGRVVQPWDEGVANMGELIAGVEPWVDATGLAAKCANGKMAVAPASSHLAHSY